MTRCPRYLQFARWIGLTAFLAAGCLAGRGVNATLVTIHNTSSSHISVVDLNTGLAVTNLTGREGTYVVDLLDNNHPYEISPGTPRDQGSHWFYLNAGAITFAPLDATRQPTEFFTNTTATSLSIGSVAVRARLLAGTATTLTGGGGQYFAPAALSPGSTTLMNLVPTDTTTSASRGAGFDGTWKNVFAYGGAQQMPFTLGPNGIVSMTGPTPYGMNGTIVPSSLTLTNFVEAGVMWQGYTFALDRIDSAQPGDGSQWLFFYQVPEPATVALWGAGAVMLYLRRRQRRGGSL